MNSKFYTSKSTANQPSKKQSILDWTSEKNITMHEAAARKAEKSLVSHGVRVEGGNKFLNSRHPNTLCRNSVSVSWREIGDDVDAKSERWNWVTYRVTQLSTASQETSPETTSKLFRPLNFCASITQSTSLCHHGSEGSESQVTLSPAFGFKKEKLTLRARLHNAFSFAWLQFTSTLIKFPEVLLSSRYFSGRHRGCRGRSSCVECKRAISTDDDDESDEKGRKSSNKIHFGCAFSSSTPNIPLKYSTYNIIFIIHVRKKKTYTSNVLYINEDRRLVSLRAPGWLSSLRHTLSTLSNLTTLHHTQNSTH